MCIRDRTKSFTITSPTKFLELDLGVQDVVEILDVRDSSNGKYYEVNYLAQDRILKELSYENDPDRPSAYDQGLAAAGQMSVDVSIPYTLTFLSIFSNFNSSPSAQPRSKTFLFCFFL